MKDSSRRFIPLLDIGIHTFVSSLVFFACLYFLGYPISFSFSTKVISICLLISVCLYMYANDLGISSLYTFYLKALEKIIQKIFRNPHFRMTMTPNKIEDNLEIMYFGIPLTFIALFIITIVIIFLNRYWYYIICTIFILGFFSTLLKGAGKLYYIILLLSTIMFVISFYDLREIGLVENIILEYFHFNDTMLMNLQ